MTRLTIEEIIASPKFPSLPAAAVRIIELVQDPDVSLPALTVAISNDAALTSKILKQANSSFYARSRAVGKLSDAFMLLGLRRVKTLALGFSLVDTKRGRDGGFDYTAFWRRSLYAAVSARGLATRQKAAGVDEEEAFLGGLMHSLGVLALNQAVGPEYQQLFTQAGGDYAELLGLEAAALGFTHAELGGRLSETWNLPRELTAALRWSATPDLADESVRAMVSCVSIGSAAADVFVCETPGPAVTRYRERCRDRFGMSPEESAKLLVRIQDDAAGMESLLDLPAGDSVDIAAILSQATETLVELSFEAEREAVQLERENSQLAVEASTDVLTGLPNRRRLVEFIANAAVDAQRQQTPLCYLMIDIDHFKRINDVHGHPGGDAVLKALGAMLRKWTRDTDLVGRYGGEEFGIVTPDTDLRGAATLAHRLCKAVEAIDFAAQAGIDVKLTVSIGVANFEPSWERSVEQLIEAADAALYEAKEAGRNVVRLGAVAAAA